ncbi:predicted protein [Sclerotinia sclerotiorum 1980 UF-70]|uniref:Uncharacterized protein n=1 Tax=Sclerotinia sclerotiorum (strain ATCC 18683 / 1980 / Ss-1) TaxID=665079 RepID=A7E990_SCLS1|nr:predicted protein [Sclerotinia sclerotiorum 1980 UF-70]EDN96942.1 predicted protein [Sclerotinia sclerotiorum 1980 UF-70]
MLAESYRYGCSEFQYRALSTKARKRKLSSAVIQDITSVHKLQGIYADSKDPWFRSAAGETRHLRAQFPLGHSTRPCIDQCSM